MRFLAGCAVGVVGATIAAGSLIAVAQDDSGGGPPVFSAPFQVLSSSGQPLLTVDETGDGPLLTLVGQGGQKIVMGATGQGMAMAVYYSSQQYISLDAFGDALIVNLISGSNTTALMTDAEQQSLVIEQNGATVVDLGVKTGRNAALRVADPVGTVVAQVGSNPRNGGAGSVLVSDPSGVINAFMHSAATSSGIVGIGINGSEVALLEPNVDSSGGKITIAGTNGTIAVSAGMKTDGQGTVCVQNNRGTHCQ
ncbi:MAG: hypothetical protein ACFCVH_05710 [Alphaproteobacteria bacterium]